MRDRRPVKPYRRKIMYNRNYNVLQRLSDRSIEAMIFSTEKQCAIAESKNDRSAVVHYHVELESLRSELQKRGK